MFISFHNQHTDQKEKKRRQLQAIMGTWLTWQYKIIIYDSGSQAEWCDQWKCTHACVFICPASLCLLIGAFDPVTIFLIVFGLFFVGIFLLLCFLRREVPLAFVVKVVSWCWILLTFACQENFWFLHQIWIRVLLGRVCLVVGSSLSSPKLYHAIPFWHGEFLLRNQLIAWWEFPCVLFVFFTLLLLIFYFCL